jgi:hypothetical protein
LPPWPVTCWVLLTIGARPCLGNKWNFPADLLESRSARRPGGCDETLPSRTG